MRTSCLTRVRDNLERTWGRDIDSRKNGGDKGLKLWFQMHSKDSRVIRNVVDGRCWTRDWGLAVLGISFARQTADHDQPTAISVMPAN